ncbi:RHOMBOID-like protein 1 [Malus domestica]|uniref:RHOMBOID-like protein 1 n=1 Tax=Malus domestica TaxID=3750 RepID=UPI0010AA1EC3|nr:RHOMBOID-like protein 1 isoform X1 [Malus domestica]
MERGQFAAPSSLEIKVVSPRRSDNVVHPGGQPPETTTPRRSFSDYSPLKRWVSWLVPSIVVANIVVFVVTMFVNDCPNNSDTCIGRFLGRLSFQPFKENPLLGPSSTTLEKMGALDAQRVVHQHQGWRLISCMWLHAGVFHVLANMLSLVFIGIRLEQEFGFVRIGFLYLMSGFGGSLLSALFIQYGISVGASGALFGLLGSMLSELISNWTMYVNKLAALLTLLFIIIINLAVGILPHVDNFAHIGGFVSGFLLGFLFLIRPQFKWLTQRNAPPGRVSTPVKSKHKTYQYVLWVLSLILLIVGYTLGLVTLFRGVNLNNHCSWCHYLSCVPTSKWNCKSQNIYCLSSQIGNQLNLTCVSNGRNGTYSLSDPSPSRTQQLCAELCS